MFTLVVKDNDSLPRMRPAFETAMTGQDSQETWTAENASNGGFFLVAAFQEKAPEELSSPADGAVTFLTSEEGDKIIDLAGNNVECVFGKTYRLTDNNEPAISR